MSKAFIKEEDENFEDENLEEAMPKGLKNYITPQGFKKLKEELDDLLTVKRPELTQVVAWAASNGDRSENADYTYGKRKLREYDKRIRFLTKRLECAEVVDPANRKSDQVFFGATVCVEDEDGNQKTYSIVGVDESNLSLGRISWISPLASALLKRNVGDLVQVKTPGGLKELEIVSVDYKSLD